MKFVTTTKVEVEYTILNYRLDVRLFDIVGVTPAPQSSQSAPLGRQADVNVSPRDCDRKQAGVSIGLVVFVVVASAVVVVVVVWDWQVANAVAERAVRVRLATANQRTPTIVPIDDLGCHFVAAIAHSCLLFCYLSSNDFYL